MCHKTSIEHCPYITLWISMKSTGPMHRDYAQGAVYSLEQFRPYLVSLQLTRVRASKIFQVGFCFTHFGLQFKDNILNCYGIWYSIFLSGYPPFRSTCWWAWGRDLSVTFGCLVPGSWINTIKGFPTLFLWGGNESSYFILRDTKLSQPKQRILCEISEWLMIGK